MKTLLLTAVSLTACAAFAEPATTPAGGPPALPGVAESAKPNVVFILADDLRADCIGAVNPLVKTPNIDRLAKHGVLFNNCYGMGATGAGVCQPSRSMIMSGRHLFKLPADCTAPCRKQGGEKPSVPVMSTTFNGAGYDTLYCGKNDNTYQRANTACDKVVVISVNAGTDNSPRVQGRELAKRRAFVTPVVDYLAEPARAQKPFFAFYAPGTPHDPLYCEPDCLKLYQGDYLPQLPPNAATDHVAFAGFAQHDTNVRSYDVPGIGALKTPLKLAQWRNVIGQYYAMVSSFDRDIGRILDELERTGAIKNTIIVFTSDNGLALSDHGLIHKSSLYEHEIKLPLIVCGPGIPEGKRSDAFVYVSDLYPTLCEMVGTPIPDTVQTKSFLSSVKNPATPARETLAFAYTEEMRAYRDARYKIILYSNGHAQLFDLSADPQEVHDLAKDPVHAQRLAEMIEKLRAEDKAWDDCEGKTFANIFRRWPMKPGRLGTDGPMFWEKWKVNRK